MADFFGPICVGIAWAVSCAAGGYFFDKDNKLREEWRERIRKGLNRASSKDNLASLFLPLFDRLFDPNGTGRPRFWRSVLASCLVLSVLSILWTLHWPERAADAFQEWSPPILLIWIVPFAVGINLIGDFFSLWETRFVVDRMAVSRRSCQAVLLLADLVATMLIYGVGLVLGAFLWIALLMILSGEIPSLGEIGEIVFGFVHSALNFLIVDRGLMFCSPEQMDYFSIFFYTTLFTSVWVWVFMLGIKLWPLFTWLSGTVLNINSRPVGALMTIGGIFSGLLFAVIHYVSRIFQSGTC